MAESQILVSHSSGTPMYGAVNTANVDILYDQRFEVDTYNPVKIHAHELSLGQALVQYPAGSNTAKKPVYLLMQADANIRYPSNQGFMVIKYQDI